MPPPPILNNAAAPGESKAFRANRLRLPLSDTIAAEPGSIAKLAIDLIRAKASGNGEFETAMGRYRSAIMQLASECPGSLPLQIERRELPDPIKNPTVRIPGLPECSLPFSLLGGWTNERLETELAQQVPPNGQRSSYLRLISRILDRYVSTFFPPDIIPDFYRPSVLRLHSFSADPDKYPCKVIECARPLADAAILSLFAENTNLLKMNSHKSISIQTGVPLTEQHSSLHKRPARLAAPDYGKRFIMPSASCAKGLDLGMRSLHPMLGCRLGLPGFEKALSDKNIRDIAKMDELLNHLSYVIRSGKPPKRSHPDISGLEFPPDQADLAAEIAIAAQMKLAGNDSGLDSLSQEALHAALFISASRPFRDACGQKDRRTQLALALSALAVELRASELSLRFGIIDAGEQAKRDIDMARDMADEFQALRGNEESELRSLKRMRTLSNETENLSLSYFEIAMKVVDERHMKNEPQSTIRPPPDSSLPPVPGPSPLPQGLQPPGADAGPAAEEVPGEAESIDIDLDEEPAGPEDMDLEDSKPTEPQEPAYAAPAHEDAQPAGPEPDAEPSAVEQAPVQEAAVEAGPQLPEFDFPFRNMPLDPNLEPLLPPKTDSRNALIRKVARALVYYKASDYDGAFVDPRCIGAVELLKGDYSPQAALDAAISIVDGAPIEAPVSTGTPAEAISGLLQKLNSSSKELVAGAMGAQACDERALSGFLALPAANRELLIQRFIARRWIDGDFRTDIPRLRDAAPTLYSALNLLPPTPQEKLAAITDPSMLSDEQKFVLTCLFHTGGPITRAHIEAFGVWVSSDPSTEEGRRRLSEYWNQQLVPAPAGLFNIRSGVWLNTPHPDRMRAWHFASPDVLSAGSLAHKLRFAQGETLSFEEATIVSEIYGKSWDEVWTLAEQSKKNLSMALAQHTYKDGQANLYYPELLALAKMPYAFSVPVAGKPGGANPIHYSAMREMEFNTMAGFLGVPLKPASGSLLHKHALTRAKLGNGNGPKPNEDSCSCAQVAVADGSIIALDMVADGMGGHNQGSNGGMTNGQVASGIAKEVFEIAAIAGWLREPEDVRKIILVADLAIVLEQIRKKAYGIALREVTKSWEANGVDVPSMNPAWVPEFNAQVAARFAGLMRNLDPVQVNNMGTTMTVAFQKKNQLWFIHCGDSDGKVIRDGDVIYNTTGHSAEYELRLGAQAIVREELTDSYLAKGIDPEKLDAAGREKFEREAEEAFEKRIEPMKSYFESNRNVVSAVLGVMPKYIHINNADHGAAPIALEEADLVWVSSDGITIPVCDHEIPLIIHGKCMGDLESARELFISLAEGRRKAGPNPTMCECMVRIGKNDDKTLTLRYAREGMGTPLDGQNGTAGRGNSLWLSRLSEKIRLNPADLALSKSFRMALEGCFDPAVPGGAVLRLFDTLISAAESSAPSASQGAYSLALSSIFLVLSKRPDREELMQELVPRIGSWSGLILKKLRESPEASGRKRLMFDFASSCVPIDAIESLRSARNADISAWADSALGNAPITNAGGQASFTYGSAPRPLLGQQTDEYGMPLDAWSTRYLDVQVVDIFGSSVIQDTARKLGVLPRDLEVMAFYVYSDYQLQMATDPHLSVEGQNIIASLGDHLCTRDAPNILEACYLLYQLRETDPGARDRKRMARQLWKTMKAMDTDAPYSLLFYNRASEYQGLRL